MAKIIYYKGKTLDDLKKMSLNEFRELVPSRIRRSLKRGFTDAQKRLLLRVKKAKDEKIKKPIKTHCRDMVIVPDLVGNLIQVHNGKEFVTIEVTQEMLGRYLGEFVFTRKKVAHSAPGIGATKSSAAMSVK